MTHSQLRRFAAALTGMAALAPFSFGQIKLIEEGDPIPGVPGEVCSRIDDVAVNSLGDWCIRVDHAGDSNFDECIVTNGALVFQQGTTTGLAALGGSTFNFLDSANLCDNGDHYYLFSASLVAGGSEQAVYRNGALFLRQNVSSINAVGLPAGSLWESITEIWPNNANQIMVGGRSNGYDVLVKMTLDASGAVLSEELIVADDGSTLPGHTVPIQGLSLSRYRNALNDNGTTMWFVDDDHTVAGGSTADDSWVYLDNAPLWREGDPTTIPAGSIYGTQSSSEFNINNLGDYVYQGALDASFTHDVVVVNDSILIAEEGTPVPASLGAWTLTSIGSTSGVFLSDAGNVVWYGDWDDPDTDIDTALFINQDVLFQEGVSTTMNGDIIDTIAATDKGFAVSDSGQYLIVEFFSLTAADPTFNGVYLYDIDATIGDSYCTTVPNSTGVSGSLIALGSSVVADNDVTLVASDLPNLAFGFFIVSQTQGFAMNPGGSSGNICLAGAVGRAVGGSILNTGTSGSITAVADLTAIPQPMGTVAVVAGETWNFQAWHRDAVGGMTTSNFTNGLSITFN
ncbi:hypothetical protein Poly30_50180 [Planctomycetes bacterium Poly30]|uniref:Uncharacterized protein n=1 Tax=Saltatorellus ferox TaxID=2528018 RepID=A0A518EZE0_9BACT|nr:hypothetical protein Poly30_50180 [Planctomycetes bacterium Poly30]